MRKFFGWSVLTCSFYSHNQKQEQMQDSTVGIKCNDVFLNSKGFSCAQWQQWYHKAVSVAESEVSAAHHMWRVLILAFKATSKFFAVYSLSNS